MVSKVNGSLFRLPPQLGVVVLVQLEGLVLLLKGAHVVPGCRGSLSSHRFLGIAGNHSLFVPATRGADISSLLGTQVCAAGVCAICQRH